MIPLMEHIQSLNLNLNLKIFSITATPDSQLAKIAKTHGVIILIDSKTIGWDIIYVPFYQETMLLFNAILPIIATPFY